MKTNKKFEVAEIKGAWILIVGDSPAAYSQRPQIKDHIRLVQDIVKYLELQNLLEVKERGRNN